MFEGLSGLGSSIGGHEDVLTTFTAFLSSASTHSMNGATLRQEPLVDSIESIFLATLEEEQVRCTIPSLDLKHRGIRALSGGCSSLEEAASISLSKPLSTQLYDIKSLPTTLLGNASDSFMSLVASRLRSSTVALIRQARQRQNPNFVGGNDPLVRVIGKLLSNSAKPICPTAVVTNFRIPGNAIQTLEGDYVLPIIMDLVLDLNILKGQSSMSIKIEAPGTLKGYFSPTAPLLKSVEMMLDTRVLLKSMMLRVREVVKKAMNMTAQIALQLSPMLQSGASFRTALSAKSSCSSLSHFDQMSDIDVDDLMPPPPRRASQSELLSRAGSASAMRDLLLNAASKNATMSVSGRPRSAENDLSLLAPALLGLKRTLSSSRTTDSFKPRAKGSSPSLQEIATEVDKRQRLDALQNAVLFAASKAQQADSGNNGSKLNKTFDSFSRLANFDKSNNITEV